MVRDAWH
jgi:hypothetical protein